MKKNNLDLTNFLISNPSLHEAALTEFSTKTFAEASLNEIIKQSNFNKGSFYYRFNEKKELYFALIDDLFLFQLRIAGEISSLYKGYFSIDHVIDLIFHNLYLTYLENKQYLGLMHNIYLEFDDLKSEIKENCVQPLYSQFTAILVETLTQVWGKKTPSSLTLLMKELEFHYYLVTDILGFHFGNDMFTDYVNVVKSLITSQIGSLSIGNHIGYKNINYESVDFSQPQSGISLTIAKGEILAVVGSSSSMKSTIGKILMNLDQKNTEPNNQNSGDITSKVLLNSETFSNAKSKYLKLKSVVKRLIKSTNKQNNEDDYFHLINLYNLNASVEKRINQLSRVELIFAGLMQTIYDLPDTIVVDQVFEHLSERQTQRFFDILLKYRPNNCTIILTDFTIKNALRYADRVAFLISGKIVTIKTVSELKEKYNCPHIVVRYEDNVHNVKQESYPLDSISETGFYELINQNQILEIYMKKILDDEIFAEETGVLLNENDIKTY